MKLTKICFLVFLCALVGLTACSAPVIATPTNQPFTATAILATSTPQPTVTLFSKATPLPTLTPTPTDQADAPFIAVEWRNLDTNVRYYGIKQPAWRTNAIASIAEYSDNLGENYLSLDIREGSGAQPTVFPRDVEKRSYSPQRSFVIDCQIGCTMIRLSDMKKLSETLPGQEPNSEPFVTSPILWSPDESLAGYLDTDRTLYVWSTDGTPPRRVMEHVPERAFFSPSFTRLAVVISESPNFTSDIQVLDTSGRLLNAYTIKDDADGTIIKWLDDRILYSLSRYHRFYYESETGEFLFEWTSMPTGDGVSHQQPKSSPDGRWIFLDQGSMCDSCPLIEYKENRYGQIFKEYTLFDLESHETIPLFHSLAHFIGLAGWSPDSQTVYLISRPQITGIPADPVIPFGLLAYHIETRSYEVMFDGAIQAVWNADQTTAYVVYPKKDLVGNQELFGAIWDPTNKTVLGERKLAGEMLYGDPALGGPLQIAWAHDGNRVAVCDRLGYVRIYDQSGLLATYTDDQQGGISGVIRWSPDDRYLLVVNETCAWIIEEARGKNDLD